MPAGETYVTYAGLGWTCAATGQVVTCTYAPTLTSGAAAPVIDVTVLVAPSVGPSIVNTATVIGSNPDPNPANNTSSDTATVTRDYNLSLTKTLTGGLVTGGVATYTLTVKNSGPSIRCCP